jgi:methionyl-tRNA formyltransferase
LQGTVVKDLAQEAGIRSYQPQNINDDAAISYLREFKADLFIVVAYGQILSSRILDIPKIFSINVHASLLPKYRGAAPINWVIIKGETTTGVTVIRITRRMDAGPIIMQRKIDIAEDDTAASLEEKLANLGSQVLIESLEAIEAKTVTLSPQNEKEVTFAPKLKKGDGQINWNKSSQEIYNLIRGCVGWPGTFTYYKGRLLKIYKARICPTPFSPTFPFTNGQVIKVSEEGLVVATGKGGIIIEELQMEGKRRITAGEFIAGYKIYAGDKLG